MALSKFKTTFILFIIFLALFTFVYFFEKDREVKKEGEIETFKVIEIDKEEAEEITFKFANKLTKVVKEGEAWMLVEPIKYKARANKIDSLLDEINDMEAEQKIEAGELSEFGLDKPRVKVVVKFKDDNAKEILIGDKNPQETKVYLKTSESDQIFLVDSYMNNRLRLDEEALKED
jgi:hypothetical protein